MPSAGERPDAQYPHKIYPCLTDEGLDILDGLSSHFKRGRQRKYFAGPIIDALLKIARQDGSKMVARIEALLPPRGRAKPRGATIIRGEERPTPVSARAKLTRRG